MNTQMTTTELRERLSTGEDPLSLSIEKWERFIKYLEENEKVYDDDLLLGGETCALCIRYEMCCYGECPFYIYLDEVCHRLSYDKLVDHIDDNGYCGEVLLSSDLIPLAQGVLGELIEIRELIKDKGEESNV